ncbi:MAG: ABC-2 transporter permease [Bacillota bacterium]
MKNLLYKEFRLGIHPMFYLVLLCGALLLIPQWVFFLAPMYFFFFTVPNIFSIGKSQNDIGFSAMMPVRRSDIVRARMASMVVLEVLQILSTAVFAALNLLFYSRDNFLMNPNAAYIGLVLVMFAVFNLIFFPMFYKTAYKLGMPVVAATTAAVLFACAAEFLTAMPPFTVLGGREINGAQICVLAGGMIAFVLLNMVAFRLSVKKFESIDL